MAFEPSVGSGVRKGFIKPDPRMIAVKLGTACLFNVCSCSIDGKTDRRELAAHQMRFGSGGRSQGKIGIAPREVCHLCRCDQFKPDIRIKRRQLRDECHKQREQGIGGGQADCSSGAQILAGKPPFERDNAAIHLLRKGDHRFTGRCRGIAFALAIKQATWARILMRSITSGSMAGSQSRCRCGGDLHYRRAGRNQRDENCRGVRANGLFLRLSSSCTQARQGLTSMYHSVTGQTLVEVRIERSLPTQFLSNPVLSPVYTGSHNCDRSSMAVFGDRARMVE